MISNRMMDIFALEMSKKDAEIARLEAKIAEMKKNHYSCCPAERGTCVLLEVGEGPNP